MQKELGRYLVSVFLEKLIAIYKKIHLSTTEQEPQGAYENTFYTTIIDLYKIDYYVIKKVIIHS